MSPLQRRRFIGTLSQSSIASAVALCATPSLLWAQASKKNYLGAKLRIVIPANTRTSLDLTGRALGDALVGVGVCDEVDYENLDGKGGTTGLTSYVAKYGSDPNTFLIGGMALLGATAVHKSAIDLTRVQPLARLTSEALTIVVANASPLRTINDLVARLRASPKQVGMGGGFIGSEDHLFAGLLVRAAGAKPEDIAYTPYSAAFQLVDAVATGKTIAGISGYGTFHDEITSGKLRALGVSSKKTTFGIKSLREQGVEVDLVNWRGIFTGQAVSAARQAELIEGIRAATAYSLWEKTIKQARWEPYWLTGPNLVSFLDIEQKTANVLVQLLKLG